MFYINAYILRLVVYSLLYKHILCDIWYFEQYFEEREIFLLIMVGSFRFANEMKLLREKELQVVREQK